MEPIIGINEVTPYDANISDDALGETECNNTMSDEEIGVAISKLSPPKMSNTQFKNMHQTNIRQQVKLGEQRRLNKM